MNVLTEIVAAIVGTFVAVWLLDAVARGAHRAARERLRRREDGGTQ